MVTDGGTTETVPRAIWSGSVTFGLVNVPVRMLSAIEEKKLHFHYVHAPDSSRIGYEKVCKAEGRPVPNEDTYRDALCEIIRAKRKGEEVHVPERREEAEQAPDLLSALRASVEAAQGRRGGKGKVRANGNGGGRDGGLAELSKAELYERAKELDVKGRADMSKDELVEALQAAG